MKRSFCTVVVLTGLAVAAAAAPAGAPGFEARFYSYNAGVQAQAIAVGDLNGDRNVDVVLSHYGPNSGAPDSLVRVLLGDGQGGFTSKGDFPTGMMPLGLSIADLNRDGVPDVAVANTASHSVSLLYGRGDGTLQPGPKLAAGLRPIGVLIEDLDRDKRVDLVAVNLGTGKPRPAGLEAVAGGAFSDSSSVSVLYGTSAAPPAGKGGKGGAKAKPTPAASPGTKTAAFKHSLDLVGGLQPVAVAACDWDADGNTDLAVAERGGNTLRLWPAKANGGFRPVVEVPLEGAPMDVTAGDVNHDGRVDLVVTVANSDRSRMGFGLAVMLGGTGTTAAPTKWIDGGTAFKIVLADADRDGAVDAVALCREGIASLHGHGDGTFDAPVLSRLEVGSSFAVARVNADENLDVLVANPRGQAVVFLPGNGDGTWGGGRVWAAGPTPNDLASADFNGDQKPDLAVANSGGTKVTVYLSDTQGGFAPRLDFESGEGPALVSCADLDGDGDADLVVANVQGRASSLVVLRNRGGGQFDLPVRVAAGVDPSLLFLADFNGDQKMDLLMPRGNTPEVLLFLGTGDGAFQPPRRIPVTHLPPAGAVGDVNADGKLDFVVADSRKNVATTFLGGGDGSFVAAPSFRVKLGPASLALGDMNGDGKLDLVVGGPKSSQLASVLAGVGDGTFGARTDVAVAGGAGNVKLLDLDGDGKLDLLMPDATSASISVVSRSADGGYAAPRNWGTGPDPCAFAAGDFNADGVIDLAVANRLGDSVCVLPGRQP